MRVEAVMELMFLSSSSWKILRTSETQLSANSQLHLSHTVLLQRVHTVCLNFFCVENHTADVSKWR